MAKILIHNYFVVEILYRLLKYLISALTNHFNEFNPLSHPFLRQQELMPRFWFFCDCFSDLIFLADIGVQLRTGYLEQGLMVSIALALCVIIISHSKMKMKTTTIQSAPSRIVNEDMDSNVTGCGLLINLMWVRRGAKGWSENIT